MKAIFSCTLLAWLSAAMLPARAEDGVVRTPEPIASYPYSAMVSVPPGYTTYYISGSIASPKTPEANGKPADWGDITYQTASLLDNVKVLMAKQGVTFADIVESHVFMPPDPALNGGIDFMGMNKVWNNYFGTKEQPNKPARATIKVAALVGPGPLLEIEFIAAKKTH